ncbi:hypothetical protein GGI10_005490 [Coemansia sp. RSA 2530]|nr:hypothetical protein GGI10_005490 [Coemansia sp. RSA 2530]
MSDVFASPRTSALFGVFLGLAIALVILITMSLRAYFRRQAARRREQEELDQEIRMVQHQGTLLAAAIFHCQSQLTPAEIEQLPRYLFSHADSKPDLVAVGYETSSTCGICLCDYSENDMVVNLPCMHAFHDQCITPWLSASDKCPFCSAAVKLVASNENNA